MRVATKRVVLIVGMLGMLSFGVGCGEVLEQYKTAQASGDEESSSNNASTEEFRSALVGEGDIALEYGDGVNNMRVSGLNAQKSAIAGVTAATVIETNLFLKAHLSMLRFIVDLPPTVQTAEHHVWQGMYEGNLYRLTMRKKDAEQVDGTRYDYLMEGREGSDEEAELLPLLSGHVVRVHTQEDDSRRKGFGILRFHFDHINQLQPEREIGGMARIAFRRVGQVHQVRVHLLNVEQPARPDFPRVASYSYIQKQDRSGSMSWFGKADVKQDGAPYENVAVHSKWRADRSGIGNAFVTGGSLDTPYWNIMECWDQVANKTYSYLGTASHEMSDGELSACFASPEELDVPAIEESLADEDPEIPAAHPEENAGQ